MSVCFGHHSSTLCRTDRPEILPNGSMQLGLSVPSALGGNSLTCCSQPPPLPFPSQLCQLLPISPFLSSPIFALLSSFPGCFLLIQEHNRVDSFFLLPLFFPFHWRLLRLLSLLSEHPFLQQTAPFLLHVMAWPHPSPLWTSVPPPPTTLSHAFESVLGAFLHNYSLCVLKAQTDR